MLLLLQALDNNDKPYVGILNNYYVDVESLDKLHTTFAYKAMLSWLADNDTISKYRVINTSSAFEPVLMEVEL